MWCPLPRVSANPSSTVAGRQRKIQCTCVSPDHGSEGEDVQLRWRPAHEENSDEFPAIKRSRCSLRPNRTSSPGVSTAGPAGSAPMAITAIGCWAVRGGIRRVRGRTSTTRQRTQTAEGPVSGSGVQCTQQVRLLPFTAVVMALISVAQLGERQTEDLKVPSSILG